MKTSPSWLVRLLPGLRGISLIELVVSIGLMSLIVLAMTQLFVESSRLVRANQNAADAQMSLTKLLGRISADMVAGNVELTQHFGPNQPWITSGADQPQPGLPGVVFASPITNEGNAQFNPWDGRVRWQKYVCYYLDTATKQVFRTERKIADNTFVPTGAVVPPGLVLTGNSDVLDVLAGMGTTDSFVTAVDSKVLLATDVEAFEVSVFQADDGILDQSGQGSGIGLSAERRAGTYNVRVQIGDPDIVRSDSFYIEVQSRVTPASR